MQSPSSKLSLPRILAFASIGWPLSAIGLPVAVFITPYYAETMGLGLTTTGLVFMAMKLWDLFTDPIMGYLVDRKPSRLGQVRHWLLLAVPILAVATYFLYMPSEDGVAWPYLFFSLIVFYTGFTMLQTPYQAWVPGIAHTYDARSRLFLWREIIATIALVTLLVLPPVLGIFAGLDEGEQIKVMGWLLIVSLPITVGLACYFVPDPPHHVDNIASFSSKELKIALNNGPLWRVLSVEICAGLAVASTAVNYLFMAKWGFGLEEGSSLILIAFFISGLLAMPLWVKLSKRTQKHIALRWICMLSACSYLIYVPFSAIGGAIPLLIAATISGAGFAAVFVLVRSMMADVVEAEQVKTGINRSGIYYSMMSGGYKLGAAFSVGLPYILLEALVGFNPNTDNSETTVFGFMLVYSGVPFVFYGLAAFAAWNYPLTREIQAVNHAALQDRNATMEGSPT